jgi:hypothetical protein
MWTDITPREACAERAALHKRFDGRRMGVSGTVFSGWLEAWPAAQMVRSGDYGQSLLSFARRASLADAAQGFPTGFDGAALLPRLARQRFLEDDQPLDAYVGSGWRRDAKRLPAPALSTAKA